MSAIRSTKEALVVAVAVGMLAGCTGNTGQSGLSPAVNLSTLTIRTGIAHAVRPDHGKSWMSPDGGKKQEYIYVSDFLTNDVYVYAYPSGDPMGTLTGFSEPQGECTQGKNVWIANTSASQLFEYKLGGTSPVETIIDSGQYPVSCAYDTKSGKLAVSNLLTTSGGNGSVSIYTSPSKAPTSYPVTTMTRPYFLGYDTKSNLFVAGLNASGVYQLAELKKDANSFRALSVSGATINFPGAVQYADGALAIGDQLGPSGYPVLYQTKISGSTAVVIGTTPLTGSGDAAGCFILKKEVASPSAGEIQIYEYPAGGSPVRSFAGPSEPIGTAIVK